MGKEPQEEEKPGSIDSNVDIDEGLYSRQLYVLGHEAMKRMGNSNVLLIGLNGLGVEIAKNLILTGIKSLTIHDNTKVTLFDLSAQFYLTEKDVGKTRATASLTKLAELNNGVRVQEYSGEINEQVLSKYQVVVMTGQSLDSMLKVNAFCHANKIGFINADTFGVFSNIFCDFGEGFVVNDTNGEPPLSIMIATISQENPAIVTVLDEHRIPFEDGDFVQFTEVKGMTEINNAPPAKVKLLSHYTFSVEIDATSFSSYVSGGYATQVKQPLTMNFLSLEEALQKPEILTTDWAKMERPNQLHIGIQALHHFHKKHLSFPAPHNPDHIKEVLAISAEINEKSAAKVEKLDETLITLLANISRGELSPMTAFIGGVTAQEVLKAVSGKFTPIKQFVYFDATEILPKDLPASEFQPIGSRHDAQIVVLGKTLQQQIENLNYFLVGAGAIGCEVLKIWALMGLGTGEKGMIHVTDMDTIEKSNLSRQFLFRAKDIDQLKSTTAANAVKGMNPHVHITSYSTRVGPETENLFSSKFYNSLHGVCNALDNVEARLYMDSRCVFHRKSLLESGTLGTKGNTQVIVPGLTESYASSRDPPEKGIPMCTLHHFPNAIEHTIQWARDVFEGLYRITFENVNSYLTNPGYLQSLDSQPGATKLDTLISIKNSLVDERPTSFENCVTWARLKFEEFFNNNIQQLLYNFPVDMITSTGAPFWSGPKRAPKPLFFNADDPLHLDFVMAAANLRAFNYKLKGSRDSNLVKKALSNVMVPEFTPKKGLKINTNENENTKDEAPKEMDDEEHLKNVLNSLPPPSKMEIKLEAIEFEKDKDENFHMDFITAAANLRASNYSIAHADKHKCKGIAGKIIPAMVTTTAVVSGLVCLELLKLIQNQPLESYKNGFVNLALPFFGFSEPIKPPTTKIREGWTWNLWDRIDVEGELTLQQFLDHFKEKYQLEVSMISCGASMLYSFFMAKDKLADRLPRKMSEIAALVSKKEIPETKDSLAMEICVSRLEDDEEVDVPPINYIFRKSKN